MAVASVDQDDEMAAASVDQDDEVDTGIDFIELSFIDLHNFSGDELRLVAQFSGHFPEASFSDIVIPKIDRSCFNESAGSRRQTWSSQGSIDKHSSSRFASSATTVIQRRSIGLTSTAVHVHSHTTDELILPDAGTRSKAAMAVARVTSNGKVKSSARQVTWKRAITRDLTSVDVEGTFATNGAIQDPVGGGAGIVRGPLSRKRLRQPIEAFKDDDESEKEIARRNRKRSRSSAASSNLGEEVLVGTKRSCGPQLRSRHDMAQKERKGEGEMMERLAQMKGKWSSSEKTWKIVDASGFPLGWTVRVGLRYKDGRTLFEYRDWRSPDGILLSSFKDASAFLLSSIGHDSTSKIVLLVKPDRGIIGDEGISNAKKDSSSETVGNVNFQGGCCSKQVPTVDLGHSEGGCSNLEETPNLTRAAIGLEIASQADELRPEDPHTEMSNEGHIQESVERHSCLLERHSCGDHTTQTDDPSKDADPNISPRISYRESTSGGMESNISSGHPNIEGGHLTPSDYSAHKCPSCGMMFSTLLKFRGHLRRAKHGRQLKCDVCGRKFSSTASLLTHRVQMGHPRNTKITRRLQFKGFEPESKLRGSKMFNIVLGLLADTNGAIGCNVDHISVAAKSSKSTENLRSSDVPKFANEEVRQDTENSDVLKVVNEEVRQDTEKNGGLSDIFECESCSKVFYRRSQYWGHQSVHSKRGGIRRNVDQMSVAAKLSKPTENLRSRDVPKFANEEVRQDTEKNGGLSGIFECKSCSKVFNRRSQYWGHQSVHSKQRKEALKASALSESVSKRSLGRVVGSEPNLPMAGRENLRCEAGSKNAVESVFWRLLDESSPLERPNHDLAPFQDEAVRPPVEHAKEEIQRRRRLQI